MTSVVHYDGDWWAVVVPNQVLGGHIDQRTEMLIRIGILDSVQCIKEETPVSVSVSMLYPNHFEGFLLSAK